MQSEKTFERIVIAFDGSIDSMKAVKLACSMASKYSCEVTVVHVYSSPTIGFGAASGMPIPDYPTLEEAKRGSAKEVLAKGLELAAKEGIKARGELIESASVVEALVEFAEKDKSSLIVVGTRGMTGFKKLILGSVSAGLVNHAPCPVLIAR